MTQPRLLACIVLIVAIATAAPAAARRQKSRASTSAGFTYYVLSLSWSPQHCATQDADAADAQCGLERHFGFVVHGLWPQAEQGFPESCSTDSRLDNRTADSMLDVMPSPKLIRHEWEKHGSCSGLDAKTYFATVRRAFKGIKIPPRFINPASAFRTRTDQVKLDFRQHNAALDMNELAVLCDGRFLKEVRICLDKNLLPRACGPGVRDRCRSEIAVRPLR